jgi:hypothetical protein
MVQLAELWQTVALKINKNDKKVYKPPPPLQLGQKEF